MALQSNPINPELKVRKIVGRTYLNENRLEEALEVYSKILQDYPDDIESLLILGNMYLASGDANSARTIYLQAQQLDPHNQAIERQIVLAEAEVAADSAPGEAIPTNPAAVGRLLQRLTGKKFIVSDDDIRKAAQLLENILQSESPALQVAEHLDEIDELLPALIELNIRQAKEDGRPDLAEALRNLQENVELQSRSSVQAGSGASSGSEAADYLGDEPARFKGHVLLLLPDLANKSNRMTLLSSSLSALGCTVKEASSYAPAADLRPEIAIISNPHVNPKVLESMATLSASGIPMILDLDTDFEHLPVSHHEYTRIGLGTPARGRAYTTALLLANHVTVPSETFASSMESAGYPVSTVPDGWTRQNPLWEKKASPRETINIGWVSSCGELEDLAMIRRAVIRILREFSNTQMVVIGNSQAYRLFESVPENRRMFIPPVAPEEYPYLLSQVDILIAPLRNQPFNLSISDAVVMEAGVKGIPWIGSPIPAFKKWHAGGLVTDSQEDWHLNLRQLVMDAEMRRGLAQAGFRAALKREMGSIGRLWLKTIDQVLAAQPAKAAAQPQVSFHDGAGVLR